MLSAYMVGVVSSAGAELKRKETLVNKVSVRFNFELIKHPSHLCVFSRSLNRHLIKKSTKGTLGGSQ